MKKVVFIGHVDTGKSTLYGHILYKSGYVTDHELDKIETQALKDKMGRWKWARILDICQEEMERGKTHEYTEMEISLNGENVSLIDTPGHQSFVREMINGISCHVKSAILMVSMIDNEFEASFERGMLKEHILLARCAGIINFIVVANKMDVIEWNQDKMNQKIEKVLEYLKNIGCNSDRIHIVALDSFNGTGIDSMDKIPSWYQGKTLFETISNLPTPPNKAFVKDEVEGNKFVVNFTLFKLPESIPVVSAGFECIMHYGGYGDKNGKECEIDLLKIEKSRMLKKNESRKILIKTKNIINVGINSRIILRHNVDTLGYGTILKVYQ